MNENKKYSINNMLLAFITFLGVVGLVALTGFFLLTPPDDIIMGQVEATQVRISGKVPGRIEAYRFSEGDKVKVGDTLVFLDTPEVLAKLQQAEAVRRAAEAQNAKAIKGARAQEIAGAYEMWQKAKAGLDIAQKSYTRVQNLFDKGVMSAQKRDEAEASYKAMAATEKAAKSQYLNDMWVTFSIREDHLKNIKIGTELDAFIPALDNRPVKLKVYYMKDMGTYAAWKATKTNGQFDSKTFEVRARPMEKVADLRPGMSVIKKLTIDN